MNDYQKDKIRAALGILSGRITEFSCYYEDLGYDTYNFRGLGAPSTEQVRARAEEIIYDALLKREEQTIVVVVGNAADLPPVGEKVALDEWLKSHADRATVYLTSK